MCIGFIYVLCIVLCNFNHFIIPKYLLFYFVLFCFVVTRLSSHIAKHTTIHTHTHTHTHTQTHLKTPIFYHFYLFSYTFTLYGCQMGWLQSIPYIYFRCNPLFLCVFFNACTNHRLCVFLTNRVRAIGHLFGAVVCTSTLVLKYRFNFLSFFKHFVFIFILWQCHAVCLL